MSEIVKALHLTPYTIIRKYRRKKLSWFTYDIIDLYDKRRSLYSLTKITPDLLEEYGEIDILIRKLMKKAKEDWMQE